jgi:CHAT domain-containing protein/tetratricopeptide (TPR) repeat protein
VKRLGRYCAILLASFTLAFGVISASPAQSVDAGSLLKQITALYEAGKYAEATALAQQFLATLERTLGPNHPNLAVALNNLALLYQMQGRYADAEQMAKRALAIMEKAFGPNHPLVASAITNLGGIYQEQGRYAEVEPLAKRALAIRERALGPDHPDVAEALANLGRTYSSEGRYTEAEPLYKRSLAILQKTEGSNHRDLARELNALAALYMDEGRYAEAEPLYKQSIAINEKTLGSDHPDLAGPINNLALLYDGRGRYDDAEPLYRRSLAIKEKAFGPEHPNVAATLINLGLLYSHEGHYADAETVLKRAQVIYEKALGVDDPHVAKALNNLASLYVRQGRFAIAEPLAKRSLVIMEKALGPDHPDLTPVLDTLADLYSLESRYTDAEPIYKRLLAIEEKTRGADNPLVAPALNNLAGLYRKEGHPDDAEPLYKRSLAILEKSYGQEHPYLGTLLINLSELYAFEGRYADAESFAKRSLAVREKSLGPDHPDVAWTLNNLAVLYSMQNRYADAEPLSERALAIREKAFGPQDREVVQSLNNLAAIYEVQGRYDKALPLVRRTIEQREAAAWVALPTLFGANARMLIEPGRAMDDALYVVQRVTENAAGQALNALAARFSASTGTLAQLVRKDQDLAAEAASLDKAIVEAIGKPPSRRDPAAERTLRDRIAAVGKERDELRKIFARDFPDYTALSRPEPLTVRDIQALLTADEALVIVDVEAKKGYVWAITKTAAEWNELALTQAEVSKRVSSLRRLIDFDRPFDTQASFELYQTVLAPIEDMLRDKPRLTFVLNGALTSLPPQLLVMRNPANKELKDVDWLVRTHAITVLPSVASLKVLRGKSAAAQAPNPLIGFANPLFNRDRLQLQNVRVAANVTASRGIRGAIADIAELRTALPPLPETADELSKVAASVHAVPAGLILGEDATETRVKKEKLDQYRIVYFATHGLLAGDVADFAKLDAEPALVLSLPEHPTEFDDGLLTASEVAQLKLNADWVVLSACNTASGDKPGAEALSGLARAFFYAGGRSLLVSNWEVDSESAVELMVGTFATLAADPKLSHAEALQKSMLAMVGNLRQPEWADPKYWAPFIVVGEPAKPAN